MSFHVLYILTIDDICPFFQFSNTFTLFKFNVKLFNSTEKKYCSFTEFIRTFYLLNIFMNTAQNNAAEVCDVTDHFFFFLINSHYAKITYNIVETQSLKSLSIIQRSMKQPQLLARYTLVWTALVSIYRYVFYIS